MTLQMYKVWHRAQEKHTKLEMFEAKKENFLFPYYKKWRE